MSRKLKRVPLDFAWPIKKTWGGYLNPFSHQATNCDACDGTGESPEYKQLKNQWYGYVPFRPEDRGSKPFRTDNIAVVHRAEWNCGRGGAPTSVYPIRRGDSSVQAEIIRLLQIYNSQWCHHLNTDDVKALQDEGRLHDFKGTTPTPEAVNQWSLSGFGHDSINCWIVVKAECARLGLPDVCAKCAGEASLWPSPDIKQASEDWKPTEPPEGEGFQLWENTSEGSPISPIFATLKELCEWASTNATTFGREKATAEQWKTMLEADFVCHKEGNAVFC